MLSVISTIFICSAFLFISIPFLLRGDYLILKQGLMKFSLTVSPALFIISIVLDRLSTVLKKSGITITEGSIIYEGLFSKKMIHFTDIKRFKFTKQFPFRYKGVVITDNDEMSIPLFIDGLPELIKNIRKGLNLLSKSDCYKNGNIADFDLKARYNDMNSSIMFKCVPYVITAFLIIFAIDVVVVFHFWEIPLIFSVLWIIQSMLYPGAAFIFSYSLISDKIKDQIKNNPESNRLPETSTTFIYSGILFTILYLASGILLRYFVETHWTRL